MSKNEEKARKIKVICSRQSAFARVGLYLERRGWIVSISENASDAMKYISEEKPDAVLLSLNLPVKNIKSIPQMIFKTLNVPVIAFGENLEPRTQRMLHSVQANSVIHGPITGPVVHRSIQVYFQSVAEESQVLDLETDRLNYFQNEGRNTQIIKDTVKADQKPNMHHVKGSAGESKSTIISSGVVSKGSLSYESFGQSDSPEFTSSQKSTKDESKAPSFKSKTEEGRPQTLIDAERSRRDESPIILTTDGAPRFKATLPAEKEAQLKHLDQRIIQNAIEALALPVAPQGSVLAVDVLPHSTFWSVATDSFLGIMVVSHGGSKREEEAFYKKFIASTQNSKSTPPISIKKFELPGDISKLIPRLDLINASREELDTPVFSKVLALPEYGVYLSLVEIENREMELSIEKFRDKVKLPPDKIFADLTVGADLFIFLSANDRFFKYLSETSSLSSKQKKKVTQKDVAIYFDESQLEKIRNQYLLNSHIQGLTDIFKKKKTG